jgi:hypothetical protein
MRNLYSAYQIIATLAYSNQFNWPLSFAEICERLISIELAVQLVEQYGESQSSNNIKKNKQLVDAELRTQLQKTLAELLKADIVVEEAGEYFLSSALKPQQTLAQLIANKKQNQKLAQVFRSELSLVRQELKKISWIKAAGVTGALAVNNAQTSDDLDFIIIVEDNRLWLSRLKLLAYLVITGQKLFFFSTKKDKWCFNLWLESSALNLTGAKQSIYGAYEAKQIDWFYDPEQLFQDFYQKNQWIEKYLFDCSLAGFGQAELAEESLMRVGEKKSRSAGLKNIVLNWLNRLAYAAQKKYVLKKTNVASTNLSLEQAFFHDDESYKKFIQEWQRLLRLSSEKLGRIV